MATTGGKVLLFQPVMFQNGIVAMGNIATSDGIGIPEAVIVGANAICNGGDRIVVCGASAEGSSGATRSTTVGYQAASRFGASFATTIGAQAVSQFGGVESVNIGHANAIQGPAHHVVIGSFTQPFVNQSESTFIGTGFATSSGGNQLMIGEMSHAEGGTGYVLIGSATVSGGGSSDVVGIGISAAATGGGGRAVVIGHLANIIGSQQVCIGSNAQITAGATADGIVVGPGATGQGYACVVLGSLANVGNGNTLNMAVGTLASCTLATGSLAIGHTAACTQASQSVAIGADSLASNGTQLVAIGNFAQVSGLQGIAIGGFTTVASSYAIGVGSATVDNLSERSIGIGRNVTITNSPYSIRFSAYGIATLTNIPGYTTCLGGDSSVELAPYSVLAGFGNVIQPIAIADPTPTGAHIGVGDTVRLFDATDGTSAFGRNIDIATSSRCLVVGRGTVDDSDNAIILGGGDFSTNVEYSVAIGNDQTVTAAHTITLGAFAENSVANSMEIGRSSAVITPPLPAGTAAIHTLQIKGYNGAALDTVVITDNPVTSGDTGLTIVCNVGAVFSNKLVMAAVAPAVGSLQLYIIP